MKPGRLFWGVFFVATGTLILAYRAWGFELPAWELSWRLWPLLLILGGVALLVKQKGLKIGILAVIALVAALALFASITSFFDGRESRESVVSHHKVADAPQVSHARFRLESGAGLFTFDGGAEGLTDVQTESNVGEYNLDNETTDSVATITLSLKGEHHGIRWGNTHNEVTARLSDRPTWDLDFNIGAAKLNADMSSCVVERLELNAGATTATIRLGGGAVESTVRIKAGASSISLEVPDSVGCEIRSESPLSSKSFRGFEKEGDGFYRTDGFAAAAHKMYIDVETGVSSIKVRRY